MTEFLNYLKNLKKNNHTDKYIKTINITCPLCKSSHIKHLNTINITNIYVCLQCGHRFEINEEEDGTDSPLSDSMPSLQTWMHCWYLLGHTNSYEYIAAKLGLDIKIIKKMIQILQKLFNKINPENNNQSFEEWSKKHIATYEKKIKNEILSNKQILLTGESTNAPKDTAEYRKQATRRRSTPSNNKQY